MRREGKQVHPGPLLELAIYNHVKVTCHGLDPGPRNRNVRRKESLGRGLSAEQAKAAKVVLSDTTA